MYPKFLYILIATLLLTLTNRSTKKAFFLKNNKCVVFNKHLSNKHSIVKEGLLRNVQYMTNREFHCSLVSTYSQFNPQPIRVNTLPSLEIFLTLPHQFNSDTLVLCISGTQTLAMCQWTSCFIEKT